MSQSARSPGVLVSVRWGDQDLAREFLRLDDPRTFSIGSDPGCDFPCGGAHAFKLIQIDAEGATFRHKDGSRTPLERGTPGLLDLGPLRFEAELLDAPPPVRGAAVAELATVNLCLMLMGAFGFFAVAAANADAEGNGLSDDISGVPARTVKTLMIQQERRQQASAAAAPAPTQRKDKPTPPASPSRQARIVPLSRPTGRNVPSKVDVGDLFKGPGAGNIFTSSGLGDDLRAASNGIRTAEAGNGIGVMGTGHGMDGNGLGGLKLEGIGRMGTHGGRGTDKYAVGVMLKPGDKMPLPPPDEVTLVGCQQDGSGCIDKEMIRRVIRQNLAGFRYCYESLLNRFPYLEGKVAVKFQIAQSGKVPLSLVASSSAGNSELERCVSDRTRLLQFPSRKGTEVVVVTYPFIFKQSGK